MEKEIFFIGCRQIYSKKNDKNYYIVDYVRNNVPKTDYIDPADFNNIAQKAKDRTYKKCTGIFSANEYDKLILIDIK